MIERTLNINNRLVVKDLSTPCAEIKNTLSIKVIKGVVLFYGTLTDGDMESNSFNKIEEIEEWDLSDYVYAYLESEDAEFEYELKRLNTDA